MRAVHELAALIRERGPAVVLTGAGMSTESGIPDFRSAGGLWEEVDPYAVASIDAFRRDPLRVWRWYGPRIGSLVAASPNEGHLALVHLEQSGHVRAVATQNIDALHSRAGSAEVIELHGSIRRFDCLRCGATETLDGVLEQLGEGREAPLCAACGAILKPGVVMFGELLPADAMARAERLCRETGLLLVLGSSLEVWPVAGLPVETLRAGGGLAIVSLGETPYDDDATLVVREKAGWVMRGVASLLVPGAAVRAPRPAPWYDCAMSETKPNDDVIGRLAGKGEQAVHRLAELPGGTRALRAFNDLKLRVDDLSRKVRGIDALEQRVGRLEKELAALKRAQKPASPQKAPARKAGP